jgi:GTP-binding protein EngB required for normal cell division
MLNRDILVSWFIKNFPDYHEAMVNSNHHIRLNEPNPFHAEGSVWTHTMMVMTWIEARNGVYNDPTTRHQDEYSLVPQKSDTYTILLTSGLLHDLGKPACEEFKEANEEKPDRNSFNGHEGVSVIMSIRILKLLQIEFPEYYTDEVVELIIKVIGTHGVSIQSKANSKFTMLRESFRIADKKGAVRGVDEGVFAQYGDRKFSSTQKVKEDKEIVFMIGLPCAGKSTLMEKRYLNSHGIVSRDNELLNFYASKHDMEVRDVEYTTAYRWVHDDDELKKEFESYFNNYVNKLHRFHDKVVIDMTMMPMSSRRKMMNKFPEHTRKAVVVMTDIDTIKWRNEKRSEQGKHIPDYVLENMAKSFVYPVMEEGFVDIELVIN